MAVWGEVCAFELPFFLFWKSGFVFERQVIWRTFLSECRYSGLPCRRIADRTQKPFSLMKENGFICGRTMLPANLISL